jgi:phosphoglycolate phosphatase-like HAD superfamily hydrolase
VSEPSATWVFDVDGCLVDSLSGRSLRPGAADLLAHLRAAGHTIVLWSAGGAEYARERAVEHAIADLCDAFHGKERRDGAGRYRCDAFVRALAGAVFVDDRPEDMPVGADVIAVSPYLSHNVHDRGLDVVLARVRGQLP